MRRGKLLMAAGLAAGVMAATACGPTTAASGGVTGATSPAPGPASGSPGAAMPASTPAGSAVAAASAAAGGGSGQATKVCSLMSSAQASAINHVTYGATKSQHVQSGYDICTYANTGKSADPVDIQALTVSVISLSGCYDQLKSADGPGAKVTGIGDGAFGYQVGLIVDDGGRCIDVSGLTHAELENDYTRDTAMAKIIMSALH